MPVTTIEAMITTGKPHHTVSIPFTKFIPNILAINVGNIKMIETEVICFITPAMLLLIMLA